MPAIQLERLKAQAAELAEHFGSPAAFVHRLHGLLDFYADRTRRPGLTGAPPPLIPAYQAAPPVLRQVIRALAPQAAKDIEASLALADALWAEDYLECRLLAAQLLGVLSPSPSEPILERVSAWAQAEREDQALTALFNQGLAPMIAENPDAVLALADGWLTATQRNAKILGLRVLAALLEDSSFENLPAVFRLLGPSAQSAPSALRPHLLKVIQALARRSPPETAFFLRQTLARESGAPGPAWLARKSLDAFPEENQISLREALKRGG